MKCKRIPLAAAAATLVALLGSAHAQDTDQTGLMGAAHTQNTDADLTKDFVKKVNNATGLEFWGYGRGGFYSASKDAPRGGYSLGGNLQSYRLGNEGDNYIEFGIGKRFDMGDGVKWGVFYMPNNYNGNTGTAQMYSSLSGVFGNSASLWAGQRFHRIQDVHIVDNWVMEDGDNYGAGIDDIPLGGLGTLNLALHTAGSFDNKNANPNNAKRANAQWRNIPINEGGKLTLTGAVISGDFAQGSSGGALGLLHNQKDFLTKGLNNSFFLQASTGHASINGKFYGLDSTTTQTGVLAPAAPGGLSPLVTLTTSTPNAAAKQRRVIEVIDFQLGQLGGQALVGYQTTKPDQGVETKDFSLGGRVSYGIAKYTKLLFDLGLTQRDIDGQAKQRLTKGTVAVAFSPKTEFWTRPEFRVYATRASWNQAAGVANAGSFGANGRRSATTFGVQMEAWWE